MTPTQAYEAAMDEFRAECLCYYAIRDAYRACRSSDAAFLAAKAAMERAEAKVSDALHVLENTPL